MRGNTAVIVCLILFVLVSGCSNNSITGQVISIDEVKELYPCLDKACPDNQVCVEGECVCDENSKTCPGNSECISKTSCCSDGECGFGETCIKSQCVFSCNNIEIVSNKVCDPVAEALVCMPGYEWCEEQSKCIPDDHCCKKFDCSRSNRCIQTFWSAEVCLEGPTKNCRFIDETEEKTLTIGDLQVSIKMLNFFYDKRATMLIDGIKEVELSRGSRYVLDDGKMIFLSQIKEYGGACKRIE